MIWPQFFPPTLAWPSPTPPAMPAQILLQDGSVMNVPPHLTPVLTKPQAQWTEEEIAFMRHVQHLNQPPRQ